MGSLLAPLTFWRVRHSRWMRYNVLLPAMGCLVLTGLLVGPGASVNILGKDHYFDSLKDVLTILGGFFIAALTLVTSNQNALLSHIVGGDDPPILPPETEPLTRRRFLAYLFGYLSFVSFVLVGFFILIELLAAKLGTVVSGSAWSALRVVTVIPVNFLLCHLLVVAMLGLMYFTDRLNRESVTVSTSRSRSSMSDVPAE